MASPPLRRDPSHAYATAAPTTGAPPVGPPILTSSLESVPGRDVAAILGIVRGSTVRAKHIGKDFLAGFKNLVGGEVRQYTELLMEAREEAFNRMLDQARWLGADAVIGVRFESSSVSEGMSEMLAYGTAVRLR